MASTDLYENFRGITTVCERTAGAAYRITDSTKVQQSREKQVLEKLTEGRACCGSALLASASAAQRQNLKISDMFPF